MANDLTINEAAATDCSALCSMPSVKAVLDRAFEPGATFTAGEIALIEPVASAVAVARPASERTIRQAIGALAASLPSQATDADAGRLKLNTYLSLLAGCDERALTYACRRCLDELDWMPTIHQLKERMARWYDPEAAAIVRARSIMRRRPASFGGEDGAVDLADVERVNRFLTRSGLSTRFAADGSTYSAEAVDDVARSDYVPSEEAA